MLRPREVRGLWSQNYETDTFHREHRFFRAVTNVLKQFVAARLGTLIR